MPAMEPPITSADRTGAPDDASWRVPEFAFRQPRRAWRGLV